MTLRNKQSNKQHFISFLVLLLKASIAATKTIYAASCNRKPPRCSTTENRPSVDTSMSAISHCRDTNQNKTLALAHCASGTGDLLYSAMSCHLPGMFIWTHYRNHCSARPYWFLDLSISFQYKGELIAKILQAQDNYSWHTSGRKFLLSPSWSRKGTSTDGPVIQQSNHQGCNSKKAAGPRGS